MNNMLGMLKRGLGIAYDFNTGRISELTPDDWNNMLVLVHTTKPEMAACSIKMEGAKGEPRYYIETGPYGERYYLQGKKEDVWKTCVYRRSQETESRCFPG